MRGSLGVLNPFPWSFQAGNCLGWIVYGYYTRDPFVVAANLPGFLVSLWLNMGAAKLQYLELNRRDSKKSDHNNSSNSRRRHTRSGSRSNVDHQQSAWDASGPLDTTDDDEIVNQLSRGGRRGLLTAGGGDGIFRNFSGDDDNYNNDLSSAGVMVPQERALMRMLTAWAVVLVWAGWFSPMRPATTIGVIVNINLVFFYGAPLQAIQTVMAILTEGSPIFEDRV